MYLYIYIYLYTSISNTGHALEPARVPYRRFAAIRTLGTGVKKSRRTAVGVLGEGMRTYKYMYLYIYIYLFLLVYVYTCTDRKLEGLRIPVFSILLAYIRIFWHLYNLLNQNSSFRKCIGNSLFNFPDDQSTLELRG